MQLNLSQIEIIDDEYELSLLRKVNGSQDSNGEFYCSPSDMEYYAQKTLLYIEICQSNNNMENNVLIFLQNIVLEDINF
ncbi:hypothetical protein IMG5_057080 [Ichthyophthirius multifiliis]|uniref:Uncharacterized protein n=1 Tax=Ichthyophthirius multifiliis TaxID=5932 RepID=G0QNC0_ICHMU|nr:hypothetical protein IMG5_057080 [Ichthyophthirius multifiliis]EGR33285.1 hypothetical protein IMG5_057080 [Ichthyophthirius multifiliis]|eukprot:XP_004037271.1 hypothetical protein IMG5_057080 [Ichthyophthirius multifiliis]